MLEKFVNFIIIGTALLIIFLFMEKNMNDLVYQQSTVDNRKYLVRNLKDKQEGANMLAKLRHKMVELKKYLINNPEFNEQPRIKRLAAKFNPENLSESPGNNSGTSYSINKGEKIVLCLRHKHGEPTLVDENTLTFVSIHEMAHVMTKSVGHTDEFWTNFKFLLKEAEKLGLYHHEDYSLNPKKYCGIHVSDTPLTNNSIPVESHI